MGMTLGVTGRPGRWRGAGITAFVASAPLAVAVLFVKYNLLRNAPWGVSEPAPSGLIGLVPFLLADVFQTLVATPLVLVTLFGWLPARPRVLAMSITTAVLTAMVTAGWLTFLGVGAWPTAGLVSDFVGALRTDAGLVNPAAYLPSGAIQIATAMVVGAFAPLVLAIDQVRRAVLPTRVARWTTATAFSIAAVAGGVVLVGDRRSELERGTLLRMLPDPDSDIASLAPFSPGSAGPLAEEWGMISSVAPAPSGQAVPPLPSGAMACQSAILVILETAAERDYSWETMRDAMHRSRWYLDRAIVARRHFSSHTKSNRSDFSILSGIYDLTDDRPIQTYLRRTRSPGSRAPGVASILRNAGYERRYYFPSRFTFEDDDWAVRYLGFDHVYEARHRFGRVLSPDLRIANEAEIFSQAVADVRALSGDQPFLFVLRTIIGHDPAFSPKSRVTLDPADTTNRRPVLRDVLGYVDSLLHNVIAAASARRDSSRIAVALVGDHGIRNLRDPDLARVPFPLVSYRVPAVVSCPSLFDAPVFVTSNTSHVDVAPTLAWVLGESLASETAHGLVMTDPRLKDRVTFVFAAKTGVDAVIQGDTIAALNRIYESPYRVLVGASPTSSMLLPREARPLTIAEARFNAVRRAQYRLIGYLSRPAARP